MSAACSTRAGRATLEVDQFMDGDEKQESGDPTAVNPMTGATGEWQILPKNWPVWAKEAGLSAEAPMTASNQRIVAKHKMVAYYEAFGTWDNVARAWYAGPGNHNFHSDHLEAGGYPSVNSYAASVLAKVGHMPCG